MARYAAGFVKLIVLVVPSSDEQGVVTKPGIEGEQRHTAFMKELEGCKLDHKSLEDRRARANFVGVTSKDKD